jgi:hypothetical protein
VRGEALDAILAFHLHLLISWTIEPTLCRRSGQHTVGGGEQHL